MVRRVLSVELGVHGWGNLEGKTMGRGQAVPEDDARDEAAGYALAVLDGHVAPFNDALLIGIAGALDTSTAAEEGYQGL